MPTALVCCTRGYTQGKKGNKGTVGYVLTGCWFSPCCLGPRVLRCPGLEAGRLLDDVVPVGLERLGLDVRLGPGHVPEDAAYGVTELPSGRDVLAVGEVGAGNDDG